MTIIVTIFFVIAKNLQIFSFKKEFKMSIASPYVRLTAISSFVFMIKSYTSEVREKSRAGGTPPLGLKFSLICS